MASIKLQSSIKLEESIIGAVLVDTEAYNILCESNITAKSFTVPRIAQIIIACQSLHKQGKKIDVVMLGEHFGPQNQDIINYLFDLTLNVASTANLSAWCAQLKINEISNEMIRLCKNSLTSLSEGLDPLMISESITKKIDEIQGNINTKALSADLRKQYEESFFNYHDPILNPDYIFSIESNGKNYGQACKGDLVVIGGGEKTKKTRFLSGNTISAITNNSYAGWTLKISDTGKLIYADTEQPFTRFQRTQKQIYDLSNVTDPNNYKAINLRRFSKKERLKLIEQLLIDNPDAEVLIIDGIVDLCEGFNNEDKSEEIVNRILQLSAIHNVCIIAVLHTNPNSKKLRGHLGTIIVQKCDCYINLAIDEEDKSGKKETTVTCQRSREVPFPAFEFYIDENNQIARDDIEDLVFGDFNVNNVDSWYNTKDDKEDYSDVPF